MFKNLGTKQLQGSADLNRYRYISIAPIKLLLGESTVKIVEKP